jgi:putative ABC transport system substrate-binding protein
VLWNAAFPGKALEMKETEAAARLLGVSLRSVEIRASKDIPGALAAIGRTSPHALITFADPLTNIERKQIVTFALDRRLPMISEIRPFAEDGGLMTYGPSITEMLRRAATLVDKILKGTKPADLPIEQPTKFELVLNLKTAKALDLAIPASLRARADWVIE